MKLDDIRDNFAVLDDWGDRYRYIIELGQTLDPFPDSMKTQENKVLGCQSQVWIIHVADNHRSDQFKLIADSDAHIVKGLVAIVLAIYEGHSAKEIGFIDPQPIFQELGLDRHLSHGRSNGLRSMIERIKKIAQNYVTNIGVTN